MSCRCRAPSLPCPKGAVLRVPGDAPPLEMRQPNVKVLKGALGDDGVSSPSQQRYDSVCFIVASPVPSPFVGELPCGCCCTLHPLPGGDHQNCHRVLLRGLQRWVLLGPVSLTCGAPDCSGVSAAARLVSGADTLSRHGAGSRDAHVASLRPHPGGRATGTANRVERCPGAGPEGHAALPPWVCAGLYFPKRAEPRQHGWMGAREPRPGPVPICQHSPGPPPVPAPPALH